MCEPANLSPIEALIPHRGTMLLIDRLVEFSSETAVAEYVPRADAWYVDEAGNMPAWIGIELMAQTVAAYVAQLKQQEGLHPEIGVLLGARSYVSSVPFFVAGGRLLVKTKMLFRDPTGLGAYECGIEQDGVARATATLKVYEPEDFKGFIKGST